MGAAATRPIVGTESSGPHQKFRHMSFFFGQLLSQNRVSQKIQGEPPPLIKKLLWHQFFACFPTFHFWWISEVNDP